MPVSADQAASHRVATARFLRPDKNWPARERWLGLWNYILRYETESGTSFLITADGSLYVVLGVTREIVSLSEQHNGRLLSYLNAMYGIVARESVTTFIYESMRAHARQHGSRVELRRFSVYDAKTQTVYISTYHGHAWKLDGSKHPDHIGNGDDGVFFADDDGGAYTDTTVGRNGKLIERLTSLNFAESGLGGITPEQQRQALIIWMFMLAFPDMMPTKPLLLIEGTQGCIAGDAFISFSVRTASGKRCNAKGGTLAKLYERFHSLHSFKRDQPKKRTENAQFFVSSMLDSGRIIQQRVIDVIDSGEQECVRVTTASGLSIVCTPDHRFSTPSGYVTADQLRVGSQVLVHNNTHPTKTEHRIPVERPDVYVKHHPIAPSKTIRVKSGTYRYKRLRKSRAAYEAKMNGLSLDAYIDRLNAGALDGLSFLPKEIDVHHRDENPFNDDPSNLELLSHAQHAREHALKNLGNLGFVATVDWITEIEPVGIQQTFDITVENEPQNFVANKFIVHNSGKSSALQLIQLALMGMTKPMILGRNKEDEFGVMLLRSPIAILDNTDNYIEWVADSVCAYTTLGIFVKRKLYTDDEEAIIRPHAFLAVATKNPASFRREDVADRCLILRLDRRTDFASFQKLRESILEDRPALLGEYLWYVNEIVKEIRTNPVDLAESNSRMADFSFLGRLVAKVMEWPDGTIEALMEALQSERDAFASEEDPLAELLHDWISYRVRTGERAGQTNVGREMNVQQLFTELETLAQARGITSWYKSPRTLAQKLRSPHIDRDFNIKIVPRGGHRLYKIWRKTDVMLEVVDDEFVAGGITLDD